jgi:hypothetical protein
VSVSITSRWAEERPNPGGYSVGQPGQMGPPYFGRILVKVGVRRPGAELGGREHLQDLRPIPCIAVKRG